MITSPFHLYSRSSNQLNFTLLFKRISNLCKIVFHQILLKKWTNYYLFLTHVASTRSFSKAKEGALLVDTKTFKVGSIFKLAIFFN